MTRNRTYRFADGERIEGTWRPIFIRNVGYHLTDLRIYADGAIWCWEWVDLDGLRAKLESGWVATALEPGARASALHLGSWRFDDPRSSLTPDLLLGEVADEIDRLNGRPDSGERCRQALHRYLDTLDEDDRLALRTAYLAVPEHLRRYLLGDMDSKDGPLAVLCTNPGEHMLGGYGNGPAPLVNEKMRADALAYFAERTEPSEPYADPMFADETGEASPGVLHLHLNVYAMGWPDDPGTQTLRNDYPAPIEIAGVTYPTVEHAYWALSTHDEQARDQIRQAAKPREVRRLALDAPRTPGWPEARTAVMAHLVRAKFRAHPDLAETLAGTGTARIHYTGFEPPYWTSREGQGRNWMGRLLELVRSELAAERLGLPS